MAKDPAFLFYPSDFIMGTMFFTDEQVGIYVKLLCAQHQHGGIIDKESFESKTAAHPILKSKFIASEEGYYNKRLYLEMERRADKSRNLSVNAKKMWSVKQKQSNCIAIASDLQMPIETVNENINEVKLSKEKTKTRFVIPSLQDIQSYCIERNNVIDPEAFFAFYESKGWKIGNQPMKNWKMAVVTWEKRNNKPVEMYTDTQKRNLIRLEEWRQSERDENEEADIRQLDEGSDIAVP